MTNQNKRPGVGVGIMILKDNKVLLGKRHEDAEKADSELHGEGTWTMPGGKLDFQEDIKQAAQREVLEEIGIEIDKDKLQLISVTNDIVEDNHFVTIGFLYNGLEQEPRVMEPDEITEWKWFDTNNPPSNMFFPSRKILNNYINKRNDF